MHAEPNRALPPAGVREIIEGIVDAVRAADSPRIQHLLDDLAQIADPAALLFLRSRLHDDLDLQAAEPGRATRARRRLPRGDSQLADRGDNRARTYQRFP